MDLADDAVRSIVAHFARLRAEHGEAFADPDLVEPNGEYFPDAFAVEPAAIERLMRRMLTYAPLGDVEIGLAFSEPEGETQGGGGCGSGACGPGGSGSGAKAVVPMAVETPDGYAVVVSTADVNEPVLLTTSLARSCGRLVLFEAGEDVDPRDEGALSELTAVASGLGVLLLKGASLYKKGCGGMRVHQGTFLSVQDLSMAVALFVRMTGKKPGAVRKHLAVTQREAFDEALAWVDTQPKLVKALADAPETLTDGVFEVESKKGILGRLFAKAKKADHDLDAPISSAPRRERSDEEKRRIAEAKALVEAAFGE